MDVEKPSAAAKPDPTKGSAGITFGKIDFGEKTERKKGPTDVAGLLKLAENKQQKLAELKQKGQEEKAQSIAEKDKWNALMTQAQGGVVKDNIKLLKKSVKRQEKEKKKSSQEWKERIDKMHKEQDAKAKKRQENIQSRIDLKKQKKFGGVSKKKGSGQSSGKGKGKRPGF
ncbi:hypothetical protein HDU91_006637 [Kappamyces sp. JEL0680]|nr:hypothetical protein HDU91_006637 [Kappamyces sp. JEL0680]